MKFIRKAIVPIMVICFTTSLYSQDESKDYFARKHEINLGAANLFGTKQNDNINYFYPYYLENMPYPYYYYSVNSYQNPSVGLGYKYHFKKNALRANLNFASNKSESNHNANTVNANTSKENNLWYQFKRGYERQINFKSTHLFFGMDCLNNKWEYKTENISSSYWNKTTYNTEGYGVSPFVGVKVFITPFLSLSAETNFKFEKYKSKITTSYPSNPENINEEKGSNFSFGPIGLISINVHL
ncbi:MAG: hypothetical protein K9J13_13260 [Saprospiraceae bacterium]|nr:hypothetical protein [Saprospiraceae bacterium]